MSSSNFLTPLDHARNEADLSKLAAPRRALFLGVGGLCLAAGAVGAFVPGLPTTVFVILASYFFARSSPSTHRRLVEHPRWGAYLRAAERRAMSRRAKISALAAMWTSVLASALLTARLNLAVSLSIIAAGFVGTFVIVFYLRTASDAELAP